MDLPNHDVGTYRVFVYQKGGYPMTITRGEWDHNRDPFVGPNDDYALTDQEFTWGLHALREAVQLGIYESSRTLWVGIQLYQDGKWTIVHKVPVKLN